MNVIRKIAAQWMLLFDTVPRKEYHAFVVSYVIFCVLGLLALSQPNAFDREIANFVYQTPALRAEWSKKITQLGDGALIRRGCGLGVLLLMATRKWSYVPALLIGVLGEMELNGEIQRIIGRVRPKFPDIQSISSFGYPSGHAGAATAFYGFWIVFLLREYGRRPVAFVLTPILAILFLLVSLSRIFLLAHWTTDVIGGISFATAWILLSFWINERMQSQARPAHPNPS